MQGKIYFHLLILCGIWSLGIIRTFADEEIEESSDFFVRHKRVVSYVPGEDVKVRIVDAKYVVIIRQLSRLHCTGTIISNRIVITAASCVNLNPDAYHIVYGTSTSSRSANKHDVIDIRKHLAIALLATRELFTEGTFFTSLLLNSAPLLPGTFGEVSGWGYNARSNNRGTNYPEHLRSIEVPVMSHQDCVNRYRPHITITDNEVCTFHPLRHSGHLDFGAGLVVHGRLAGVFLWSGLFTSGLDAQYPEVYANLQNPVYNRWIASNMQEINRLLEMYD